MASRYAVVSLPLGALDSSNKDDAISSLSATVSSDIGSLSPFNVPDFKIGTLDALVQQADDLAKLESTCHAVVAKVGESLKSILNNDEERLASYKMVNDSKLCQQPRVSISVMILTCAFSRANGSVFAHLLLEQDSISKRQITR